MPRKNRMRERCEKLLEDGETILLAADATCKLGLLSDFGMGGAYLTELRILWLRRDIPVITPLLFWIPDVVEIQLSEIDTIRKVSDFSRAWLDITTEGKNYKLRMGRDSYLMLRDNPETTEEWFQAIR